MKKIKYFMLFIIMLIPVCVNALNLSDLPPEIQTKEGIVFNIEDDKYAAYVYDVYDELNIITDDVASFSVEGNKNIILNDDITIQNFKFVTKDGFNEIAIVPFVIHKQGPGNQSIILTDIDVVGYDLKYNPEKSDYVVSVPSNIDEVYIKTTKEGNLTIVNGDGLVELKDKKTKVEITVINDNVGINTYTVTIVKKNTTFNIIIVIIIIFGLLVGVLLFFFKKYQDKLSKIDPNILKSKVKELDVEDIIKKNAEKKEEINAISNETITPGVLTPRTLIPEEDKK